MTHPQSIAAAAHEIAALNNPTFAEAHAAIERHVGYGRGVPTEPGNFWCRPEPEPNVWYMTCRIEFPMNSNELFVWTDHDIEGPLKQFVADGWEFRGPILPPDANAAECRREGM